MALARYGSGVIDINGKFAGQVHTTDKSGKHVSASYYRHKQPTSQQLLRRRWFSKLAGLWKTTVGTEQNQILWSIWSRQHPRTNKKAETYYLTSFQAYLSWNLLLVMNGLDPVTTPPDD